MRRLLVIVAVFACLPASASGGALAATGSVPPPINTAPPVITGTAQDGQQLSVSSGSWSSPDPPAHHYQWQRCGSNAESCASFTIGPNLTPSSAAVGYGFLALVSATDREGQTKQVATAVVGPVAPPAPPSDTTLPTISGAAQDGRTLSATSGSWRSPDHLVYTYQWERCSGTGTSCSSITGATNTSYRLTSADAGHEVTILVTATDKEAQIGQAAARAAGPIAPPPPPADTVPPTIAGNLFVGDTIYASQGAWTSPDALAYSFRWKRCGPAGTCAIVSKQASSAYTLTSADVGDKLIAVVTATDGENQSTQASTRAWGPAAAGTTSPIVTENSRPGDNHWTEYLKAAPHGAIQGYSSEVSVAPGGTLHLHVSSSANYRVEIDRLGWYRGAGGRRIMCVPNCSSDEAGQQFSTPSPDPTTGELDAGWPVTDTVPIGSNWTTGYYIAMFVLTTGSEAGKTAWYPFIVTPPPGSTSAILVQVPVNTWQAYDPWPGPSNGGMSLYTFDSANNIAAVKVSFNRPLMPHYQSVVFGREYQAVRWLERLGYDVGYYTDVDIDQNPSELLDHTVDMQLGHDEYWSMGMRDGWDTARADGHDLVFLGADVGTWQVRYEDGWRTLVEYRHPSLDPETQINPELTTEMFRALPNPPMPECELEGVQYAENVPRFFRSDYTVTAEGAASPWGRAAALTAGETLPAAVNYEWDMITPGCRTPPLTDLFHFASTTTPPSPADAVTYTDPSSGAQVFAGGSDQISLLLDAYRAPKGQTTDPQFQAFVAAMLDSWGV